MPIDVLLSSLCDVQAQTGTRAKYGLHLRCVDLDSFNIQARPMPICSEQINLSSHQSLRKTHLIINSNTKYRTTSTVLISAL